MAGKKGRYPMTTLRTLALAVSAALIAGCATTESSTPADPAPVVAPQSQSQPQPQARGSAPQAPQARAQQGAAAAPSERDLKKSVYYAFDGYDVRPEYRTLVEQHARYLRDNPSAKIVVEGNADERGSREYNVALGQKRAESVMKMMVVLGARANQIEAVSYGEEKPRLAGHDESAWAENRRSDFVGR
jgi:peptidoglycan-associated lipoprotein